MPLSPEERARVDLTVSCRDTETVPKVADAGQVLGGTQVMHNGVRIVEGCYYGAWMTEVIRALRGHHEPQEELAFHAVVERLAASDAAPAVLELGAFWSYYALWTLHRIPDTRAFLVEPDPAYLEVGRRNFELNGREGIFLQAAVGAGPSPGVPFSCESDGVTRSVPVEGLASLLERFELERVDVVLVDVQGAEVSLLEAGREVLGAGQVRFLVVSTHHHLISGDALTHQRCLELIRSCGGHVIAEHTVAESFSGDGLIAAAFDPRDRDLSVSVSHARASSSLFGDPLVDLSRARDELAAAGAALQVSCDELAAVTATRTWQIRNRVLGLLGRLR